MSIYTNEIKVGDKYKVVHEFWEYKEGDILEVVRLDQDGWPYAKPEKGKEYRWSPTFFAARVDRYQNELNSKWIAWTDFGVYARCSSEDETRKEAESMARQFDCEVYIAKATDCCVKNDVVWKG